MEYLPRDEFDKLFRQFKRYTFRLETLTQYLVPMLDEEWESYQRGDPLPNHSAGFNDWIQMIRETISAGKSISRVHLWPEKITPYLRYETEWGYAYTAAAGDDIRILLPSAPKSIRDICTEDFWLFDDELVVIVDYKADGTVIGAREMADKNHVPRYVDIMKRTLEAAIPLREYLRMVRTGEIAG